MVNGRVGRILLVVAGAVCVGALYIAGSWANQFVYDDHQVIEKQYPIRHWNDVGRIFAEPHYLNFPYYRPMVRVTFALQQRWAWGRSPRAYHIFNAVLAGMVVVAAYGLLRREAFGLTPCRSGGGDVAGGASGVFGVCVSGGIGEGDAVAGADDFIDGLGLFGERRLVVCGGDGVVCGGFVVEGAGGGFAGDFFDGGLLGDIPCTEPPPLPSPGVPEEGGRREEGEEGTFEMGCEVFVDRGDFLGVFPGAASGA